MGMYDDIVCKYPLPLPADTKGYVPEGFQTKDLENILNHYEIRDDGTLWLYECEHVCTEVQYNGWPVVEENNGRWTFCKITKTIRMYDYQHANGEYDYSVEFEVVFVDGVINRIELIRFETIDNKERKENNRKFIEELKKRRDFELTPFYRFFGRPYNKVIKFISRVMYVTGTFMSSACWKLERKFMI